MANRKHLALLKQGVGVWNAWRRTNPGVRPSLSGASLFGATLCGADLRETDLRGADLSHADLRGADLFWASLDDADLRGTGVSEADLIDALGWLAGMRRPEVIERQEMGASGVAR